jgi:transcriptional regulator with XRE-family HTH domain
MAFGEKLKEAREKAGLSQTALAEKSGLHRFTVAKYEQGLRQPTFEAVDALARALGVSCEAFRESIAPPAEKPKGKGKKA